MHNPHMDPHAPPHMQMGGGMGIGHHGGMGYHHGMGMRYDGPTSQVTIIQNGYGSGGGGFVAPQSQGVGMRFNRWASPSFEYHSMLGFRQVDYSSGWNPSVHDIMLKNSINQVFMQYDQNRNGQLEGHEFFQAYCDLCLRMGLCPPQSQQEVWQAAMQGDTNGDGMVSPMEMFVLFKHLQGVNAGIMMQPGMMNMSW
jgi:hypothetical protein